MQAKLSDKLTAHDFVYVNDDEVFGRCYQNGPYVILVGARSYYAANYQGRTIAYNLRCFPAAVEACAKHDAARRAHLYTRRCQMIEEHGRLRTEQE